METFLGGGLWYPHSGSTRGLLNPIDDERIILYFNPHIHITVPPTGPAGEAAARHPSPATPSNLHPGLSRRPGGDWREEPPFLQLSIQPKTRAESTPKEGIEGGTSVPSAVLPTPTSELRCLAAGQSATALTWTTSPGEGRPLYIVNTTNCPDPDHKLLNRRLLGW